MKVFLRNFLFDDYTNHWKKLFLFLFAELILVYFLTKTPLYALGDCYLYYELAQTFWVNNGSFFNFDFLNPTYAAGINVKGYLFPLILAFPYKLSAITGMNPEFCIQMLYIILFILLFMFVIPKLYKRFSSDGEKTKIPVISIVIFSQIFLYFWYGYLLFPLSDIPAVTFFLLGVIFFMRDKASWYHFFIAGLFFTAAYNTRTMYLYPMISFILFLFFTTIFNKQKRVNGLISLAMLISAFVVLGLPQLYVNINKFSSTSLMVQNGSILKTVLLHGYYVVSYITAYGDSGRAYSVLFTHPKAFVLFNSIPFEYDYSDILSLYLSNIKITLTVFFLKIYSSIDVWLPITYIPEKMVDNFSSIFRNINYLIWFTGLASLIFIKFNFRKFILLSIVLMPSLIAYLGHVETRYFTINFILIYMVISVWIIEEVEVSGGGRQLRVKAIISKITSSKVYIAIFVSSFIVFMLLFNYLHSVVFSLKV